MRTFIQLACFSLLLVFNQAFAGHVAKGSEASVVMLYCVIDTSKSPIEITVEAVSSNATRHSLPNIRPGEPCAQALHEYLTAGFEVLNHETATSMFVLVREDKAIVHH